MGAQRERAFIIAERTDESLAPKGAAPPSFILRRASLPTDLLVGRQGYRGGKTSVPGHASFFNLFILSQF